MEDRQNLLTPEDNDNPHFPVASFFVDFALYSRHKQRLVTPTHLPE